MLKKNLTFILTVAISSCIFFACGSSEPKSYVDGSYEGKSQEHTQEGEDDSEEGNGYGIVNITVKDGAISECTYQTYMLDGTLKDSEYGKEGGAVANQDYYTKAQKAVAACDEYAAQLVETGSLSGVDAISGATINYEEFKEAVEDALSQAEE